MKGSKIKVYMDGKIKVYMDGKEIGVCENRYNCAEERVEKLNEKI